MPLGQILKAVYFYILLKLLRQKNLNLSDSSKQGLLSFPHPFDTDSDLFAHLCQQAAEKDIVEEKGSMLVKTGSLMHQHQSCSGTKQGSLPLLSSTAITLLVFTKKKVFHKHILYLSPGKTQNFLLLLLNISLCSRGFLIQFYIRYLEFLLWCCGGTCHSFPVSSLERMAEMSLR